MTTVKSSRIIYANGFLGSITETILNYQITLTSLVLILAHVSHLGWNTPTYLKAMFPCHFHVFSTWFSTTVPYGSKDPTNPVLGPKYWKILVFGPYDLIIWVLGPSEVASISFSTPCLILTVVARTFCLAPAGTRHRVWPLG